MHIANAIFLSLSKNAYTKFSAVPKGFLRIIADKDMDAARAQVSYNTYHRYLEMLSAIGVNPITIPADCGIPYIQSPIVFPTPFDYPLAEV